MKIEIKTTQFGPVLDIDQEFLDADTYEQQALVEDAITILQGFILDLTSEAPDD